MNIGIDQLHFHIPNYYLDLAVLAEHNGVDLSKYHKGIGQEKMSVASHDEDIVTLAANAAAPLLTDLKQRNSIDTLLFATESGIDQSKAAGLYLHSLLDLPSNCRILEVKQACYSATASLQLACDHIARQPNKKVLVIASDIARYDLGTPAEATQGAGAVALLISANPRLVSIDPISGKYSEDVMDFWRPNYRKTALVDGKYSAQMYLKALKHAWQDYQDQGGHPFNHFSHFCYHLPFSKMGVKAHQQLAKHSQNPINPDQIEDGMRYNRLIGNSYTASLYFALSSLLDHRDDLAKQNIAFFSYGSGCVGEFFSGQVQPNYQQHRHRQSHQHQLTHRQSLDYATYQHYWHNPEPSDGSTIELPQQNHARYRLAKLSQHKRHYQKNP